uniref:Uncharacterized protein n=1 Tax=Aegilops tauschii TaxID=37682 RepID=R7W806_AEGTA
MAGSLSRIVNPRKHLFYPSTAHAQQHQIQQQQKAKTKAKAMAEKEVTSEAWSESTEEENYNGVLKLPAAKLRVNTSPQLRTTTFDFLPFYGGTGGGRGEERILGVDGNGNAVLCDADTGIIAIMPSLDKPKGWDPISLCVTHSTDATADTTCPDTGHDPDHPDALYVMDGEGRSFEALVYGDPDPPPPHEYMDYIDRNRWVWHWRPLPPPPIMVDGRGGGSISVESYALLNGHGGDENASNSNSSSTICVSFNNNSCRERSAHKSAPTGGTYCFDTGTGKWAKAGDWMLPFWYRALHVPELGEGLLFGFQKTGLSVQPRRFCAVDVSGAMRMDGSAPVLRHAWVDVDPPPRWDLQHYSAVYLGEGRFCIHRSFDIMALVHGQGGEEDASSSNDTICVSFNTDSHDERPDLTPLSGTYCFNTRTGEWTKAGDWKLPFWSRALHVPELGSDLLFGFENTYFHIHSCFSAVDVSGARRMDGSAPALRHAWVEIDPPSGWHEQDRSMVYLGDGKFCIHRSFDIMETYGWSSGHEERVDTVVLLTGVEVVREGSRLRMVKHKSKRLDTYIDSIL